MSRRVVEGAMVGSHRSPFKGFSTEFADHREYVKGDDLKYIDWRVFSRTERYYIKQFEENTNLRGHIVLDCSGSMAFPARAKGGRMTKYDYACHLAAGFAYVLVSQQDPVGLVLFNEDVVTHVPPMRSLSHLRRILRAMDETTPSCATDSGKALRTVAGLLKRRGLLVIISDLLDEPDRVARALAQFRHRGHDAIVVQVLDEAELAFPFRKTVRLMDMEDFGQITVDGSAIGAAYAKLVAEFVEECKKNCFEYDFDYVLANTSLPYESLLMAVLTRRQR